MRLSRSVQFAAICMTMLFLQAGAASASVIRQPTGSPFAVAGGPSAFVVVASGFTPNANVFVEQCDGVPVSTTGWSPTIDCDLGSSPPPASADANGVATFDGSKIFQPFQGESPQGLFNCLSPRQSAPANQLHSFTNCQVRVSSNNSSATSDQTFLTIVLPAPGTPAPPGATTTTVPTPKSTRSSTVPPPKLPGAKTSPTSKAGGRKSAGTTTTSIGAGGDQATGRTTGVGSSKGSSRSLTGPGAVAGYALVAVGLVIALGASLSRLARRRRTS